MGWGNGDNTFFGDKTTFRCLNTAGTGSQMSDENAVEKQAWWKLPKFIIGSITGAIALIAALITNSTTILNFLGYGPKAPQLSLTISSAIPAGLNGTRYFRYVVQLIIKKTGDGHLRDCTFSAYVATQDVPITHPTSDLALSDGLVIRPMLVYMDVPSLSILSDGWANISLICDKASSKPISFRFPPVPPNWTQQAPDWVLPPAAKN